MGTGDSFPGVKRLGREADHSHPSSVEVRECVREYVFMAWCLVKHRDNFTFTFYCVMFDVCELWIKSFLVKHIYSYI